MTTILVAADAEWVRNQVRSAFVTDDCTVVEVVRGQEVIAAVKEHAPELVILDMQIANMGGIACAIELRLEEEAGRAPASQIILLLDRDADRFLAKRAAADEVLVKPVDAGVLRRAAKRVMTATASADA